MSDAKKQVTQASLAAEKEVLKALEREYQKALKDIDEKVKVLNESGLKLLFGDEIDRQNAQSKIYQMQYQKALRQQINAILDKLHSDEYTTIQQYLNDCYTNGYVGTMFEIANDGIPIVTPIDQKAIIQAIQLDSKLSEPLYDTLGIDVTELKKTIRSEVSRGIATGLTYNDIARNIENVSAPGLKRAKTIARTEGHRIQEASSQDARMVAKSKGADIVKQWDAALDGKTRETHRKLDGQIVGVDEYFEMDGKKAKYPGDFGDPAEDCNCRCTADTRAKWELDEDELKILQSRAKFFGLQDDEGKVAQFDNFKKNYLKITKTVENSGKSSKIESISKSVSIPDDYVYLKRADTNFEGKDIDLNVLKSINDSIATRKSVYNDFYFDEIKVARFSEDTRKSVFITNLDSRGNVQLYLNTEYFTGNSLEYLNDMCMDNFNSNWWKSRSVGDLVNHEIMHARINYHNSYEKVERLYETLKSDQRVKGFCKLVDNDPSEFMNEMYVSLCRGEDIEKKYLDVFREYEQEFLGD